MDCKARILKYFFLDNYYFLAKIIIGMSIRNFFAQLFAKIFSPNDPELVKKRELAKVLKNISKTKFSRWYRPTQMVTADMAEFFFEVYKTVGPAKALFDNATHSRMLKFLSIEHVLTKEQKALLDDIDEERIRVLAKTMPYEALAELVNKKLKNFEKSFSDAQAKNAHELYHAIKSFVALCSFDYYFLLKQFDERLMELNFSYRPVFQDVAALAVLDSLENFLDILLNIPFESDWDTVIDVIGAYKNVKPVNLAAWKKTEQNLKTLRNSLVLENIIRHASGDPYVSFMQQNDTENISQKYMSDLFKNSEAVLTNIKKELNADVVIALVKKIFMTDQPYSAAKYYTVNNPLFAHTQLAHFVHGTAFSYLKSFLFEYFKTEVRDISDLFLVRAIWNNPEYVKEYSESYHELFALAEAVHSFDENLKEGNPLAMKIKASLAREARDPSAHNFVIRKVNELNTEAYRSILSAARELLVIGKTFRRIIEDYDKPQRDLLANWGELEANTDRPLREWLVEVYTKIGNFIKLEQILTAKNKASGSTTL